MDTSLLRTGEFMATVDTMAALGDIFTEDENRRVPGDKAHVSHPINRTNG